MKSSLHNFLIASSLAFSLSSHFSLGAAAIVTPLSESFDGSDGGTFSKETNDDAGVVYGVEKDIFITNVGNKTEASTSCFQNNKGSITFLGHQHSLSFTNINTTAAGAAVNAKESMMFSGFSKLSFALTPPLATQKGAVKSGDSLVFEGNGEIFFDQNKSVSEGGAISAEALTIRGTQDAVSFCQNQAKKGGAIYATEEAYITANGGMVYFLGNTSTESGGAIYTEKNTTISGNSRVIFNSNSSGTGTGTPDASGGAIYCVKGAAPSPVLTIIGNRELSFLNNFAKTSGGAICADKLVLASGGPTVFLDNYVTTTTTPKGGAIAIKDNGEIGLSADGGDIMFSGNLVNNTTTTHNAIDVGSDGKFTNLRALGGNGIYFYDPVTMAGTSTEVLNINKADADSLADYSGKIVFSGEKLTETEASNSGNLTSTFKQPINLTSGQLILKNGVTVKAAKISQTEGSQIILDAGTTLEAETEDIVLNGLSINADSLDGTKQVVIKTSADNKAITIAGPITFVDSGGMFYENHDLLNNDTFKLLQLSSKGTTDTITLTDVPQAPEVAAHYGYQGTWELAWVDVTGTAADPQTQTATVKWTRTGYIPNPERVGSLVPNSLWGACIDLRSLHQMMSGHADSLQAHRGFWYAGIGNFFHRDKTSTQRGFRHISAGYALGSSKETLAGNLVSFAFSELFCKEKDYLASKMNGRMYSGSLLVQHIAYLDNLLYWISSGGGRKLRFLKVPVDTPVVLETQMTYGQAHNSLKTVYTDFPWVKGNWKNHCLAFEGGGSMPIFVSENGRMFQGFSPFVRIQVIYVHQNGFEEKGIEGRHFDDSRLTCCSLPMGLKFEKLSKAETFAYDISIVYTPDIIQNTPDCTASLVVSGMSWNASATDLARQALAVRTTNHYSYNNYAEFFSLAGFEWRSSSRNYMLNAGCKVRF